jgi:hypothetical protein
MTTLDLPLPGFAAVLGRAWTWLRRALVAAALAAVAVIVLEAIHLFELLARIHPWVAWGVFGGLGVPLTLWASWRVIAYLRTPRVESPPVLPPAAAGWHEEDRARYVAFARRYLERQRANPWLPEEVRAAIPGHIEELQRPLEPEQRTDVVTAAKTLQARTEALLDEVLRPIDAEANRRIRRAAVEVAVATAVSPSILMDSLITLTRNVDLMSRLAALYYGRPGLGGTLRVLRDVFGSAVAAGALEAVSDHLTGALSEMAGSWTGRILGPLGQGMVNGVVTMRFGAATKRRCRSLGSTRIPWLPWRFREYRRAAGKLRDWLAEDVGPAFVQPLTRWMSGGGAPPTGEDEEPVDPLPEPKKRRGWRNWFRKPRPDEPGAGTGRPDGTWDDPLLDSDLME